MRFLLQLGSQLVLAAIALIVVNITLSDVQLHIGGFFVALGVFVLAQLILAPLVMKLAQRYASQWLGAVGLVSTLLALWVATLFTGGLEIRGIVGWVFAPIIVWAITALGGWVFMKFFAERLLQRGDTAPAKK